MNRPPEIVQEAISGLEDMLVRFKFRKNTVMRKQEVFYLQVVLEELGRLRAALFALAQP